MALRRAPHFARMQAQSSDDSGMRAAEPCSPHDAIVPACPFGCTVCLTKVVITAPATVARSVAPPPMRLTPGGTYRDAGGLYQDGLLGALKSCRLTRSLTRHCNKVTHDGPLVLPPDALLVSCTSQGSRGNRRGHQVLIHFSLRIMFSNVSCRSATILLSQQASKTLAAKRKDF